MMFSCMTVCICADRVSFVRIEQDGDSIAERESSMFLKRWVRRETECRCCIWHGLDDGMSVVYCLCIVLLVSRN